MFEKKQQNQYWEIWTQFWTLVQHISKSVTWIRFFNCSFIFFKPTNFFFTCSTTSKHGCSGNFFESEAGLTKFTKCWWKWTELLDVTRLVAIPCQIHRVHKVVKKGTYRNILLTKTSKVDRWYYGKGHISTQEALIK